MTLPPAAIRAAEPKPLRRNGGVDVSRVALLGRDPDVIADVARIPRMNLCDGTTHVHWTEHRRVAERERIVLSARGSRSDKPDRGNSGDRKETSQLFSLRGSPRRGHAIPVAKNSASESRYFLGTSKTSTAYSLPSASSGWSLTRSSASLLSSACMTL